MKKFSILLVLLVFCSILKAGFVTFDCNFPDDPQELYHEWAFDFTEKELTLGENISQLGDDDVIMSGETTVDPIFHVVKTVINSSDYAWDSYELTLAISENNGGAGGFVNSPQSSVFTSASLTSTSIVYSGSSVGIGDSVVLEFDVEVSSTGLFSFCLTQNPIPEPMTVAILGLGGIFLIRRKR